MKKSHAVAVLVVALLLALGAYWYWSPFLAVRELQQAAKAGDADAFNAHVDYPKLRESLKKQMADLLARKIGASADSGNPLAALGGMIGGRLINPLVDAMVRPETVMAAMSSGRLGGSAGAQASAPVTAPADPAGVPAAPSIAPAPTPSAAPPATTPSGATPEANKARWIIDREGASRMTAYAVDPGRPDEPNSQRLGLVFERSGFVDWKLTDIRLPATLTGKP
jgi:Protein of unknown function (DUF2939)